MFFRLGRPPNSGWSTVVRQVAVTSTDSLVVAWAAWQVHRPDLFRSPKRVLAHLCNDGGAMKRPHRVFNSIENRQTLDLASCKSGAAWWTRHKGGSLLCVQQNASLLWLEVGR